MAENSSHSGLIPGSLSKAAFCAFSIGTAVGWGSLVVTNNTYLKQAGPAGSVIGIVAGMIVMILIAKNYSYMMNAYPEAGGAYTYSKEVFGYDHGFLTGWFLCLTYLAILWANATSLPLFARYFLGDLFRFGKMYTLFNYDVYLGEALLSIAGIVIFALFCSRFNKSINIVMVVMAVVFTIAVAICFLAAVFKREVSIIPSFAPDASAFSQIVKIACISPWAFIGFESVSHRVEEFDFKRKKIFRLFVISLVITTLIYVFVMLLSVTWYPEEYSSWLEYISDLGNLEGIKALPAFYAAEHYMGTPGVAILMLALLSLIFTSLIGNMTALSRLLYAASKDEILPSRFSGINKSGVPGQAILLIACISCPVPFLGRTAVGWIVDVTTLGAMIIYCYVSASTLKLARSRGDKIVKITGFVALVLCADFGLYILLPNLFTTGAMETESFFLFVVWAVVGFIFFHTILKRDKKSRYGKSIIVWVSLLSLILFISLVWMSRTIMDVTDRGMSNIEEYYTGMGIAAGPSGIVTSQMLQVRYTAARSIVVVILLFGVSLGILLNNYNLMSRRALESEQKLGSVQERAFRDALTGVKSKLAYAETEQEMTQYVEDRGNEPFAVVVCDVNGLKHINDTLGHKAGDDYIRSAAHLICGIFAHSPVFRIGGDEFVVILKDHDFNIRSSLMEALHRTSAENIGTERVVVSGGLAEYNTEYAKTYREIFKEADDLMYAEKRILKSMGAKTRD